MQNAETEKLKGGFNKNLFIVCNAMILASIIISGTILYNNPVNNNVVINGNDSVNNNVVANGNVPEQQPQNQLRGTVTVSVDDDPVLGDKNAPLTMIEFSDYECPFCKRHFTDVYPQIKKDYIDTGKLKLVYRDFIAVPGHNPLATSEAVAASCARDQGGDLMYFKYHDAIFTKTISNGNGLALSELPAIAKSLGLNVSIFQNCLDSNKYKDEVAKDIADASKAGAKGTPSFFVGKTTGDGAIQGTMIVGAQPFSVFKVVIDEMLK